MTELSRRQVLQLVGGLAAAGGLAACGGNSGSGSSDKTVSAWSYRPEYKQAIEEIIAAFAKDNPDITVDMSYKPTGQYPTLLKTALVGGTAPDAIATNGAAGIWGDTGADGGYITELDGKFPLDALLPSVRNAVQYKGHVYGAPVQIFKIGVYYQRSIFDKYHLQPPTTWDELVTLSRTLSQHDVTAWAMPAQDMIIPFFFYHLAVNSILGADGYEQLRTGKRKLTDPDLVPAAQLMVDLMPYYNRGFQSVAYAEGKALFASGRTAMTIGGSSDLAGYQEVNKSLDVGFFGFPAPNGPSGTALNGLSMAYSVNKKAGRPAEAATFVSWLTSERAQQLVLKHLGLPSRQGIVPDGDDLRSRTLKAILQVPDSPSWLDYPETGGTATVAYKAGGVFTKRLTAAQFAQQVQEAIKVSP